MNSAVFGYLMSREKTQRSRGLFQFRKTVFRLSGTLTTVRPPYPSRRVDSRTTNSGATLRWCAATSRFSSTAVDALENNADRIRTHRLHGLANGGERRSTESRGGDIVEADHRTMLRHAQAGFGQGADGAEGGHIVEGQQARELALLLDQILGQFLARLKAGKRIARFRQVDNQTRDRVRDRSPWRTCECRASAENCRPKSWGRE